MPYSLPDPNASFPITLPDGSAHRGIVHLRAAVADHPQFEVGAQSYASDFDPPAETSDWATRLAPYLFPFSKERLVIGKFCQIAHGVRFITASANHAMDGLTAYPFPIFAPDEMVGFQPDTRDTIIGSDVWIGYGATILPGARIGHGAIIGAQAVVRGTVPDYGIVTGNPGTVSRRRFADDDIAALLDLAWWDWPIAAVEAARGALEAGDLDALRRCARD